jgi:CubicO group peptidase (beta-lactamase class C family)
MSHSTRMHRRDFLVRSGRAALGVGLFSLVARAESVGVSVAAKGSARATALITDLDRLIPELMKNGIVPGVSLALIEDAKVIWQRSFGIKDAASQESVDPDTIFEAASMSKSVFAYAVMKLAERGILDLDAPLTRYLKTPFLAGDSRIELITPRRVLCHTSGFQNWRSDANPLAIQFTPGEKFLYSGEGYNYLQAAVTQLTGRPIEQFMQANVFEPFGMGSSGYVWGDRLERHAARPHDREGKPLPQYHPTSEHAARYAAAGALRTTPSDYAKFLLEILAPKPDATFRLSGKGVAEMVRPQVKVDETSSWALGWKIQHTPKGDLFQHHGGHKGAQAFASASLARKSGYVVMTNSDNGWKVFFDEKFVEVVNRFLLG